MKMWCVAASLALLAAVNAVKMSDELFYRSPRLFHMDDYDQCQFNNGTYCMGIFQLSPGTNAELFEDLMQVAADKYNLNRSLLYRGICVTSCAVEGEGQELSSPVERFERCVDQTVKKEFGLRARLKELNYCKSKEQPTLRPKDYTDYLFAAAVALILLANVVGTVYDFKKDPCARPNKMLMAWSFRKNWSRLTTVFSGDQRLDSLAPIHGIKSHMIVIVILAHTIFAQLMVYPLDARDVDNIMNSLQSNVCMNGTMVVQTFAMVASFLLAYMILVNFEKAKKPISIRYWPLIVFNRFMRMAPSLMFVVGLTATWSTRISDGPQWYHVEVMESACRHKWWAQLLFINNIIAPDDRCLVQSWFFAVEMQLFLVGAALALVLGARPRYTFHVLGALYVVSVLVNFALNIWWHMQPAVAFATPDNLRTMAVGVDSYVWMFQATWTSAPSCLHGLILAFAKHRLEKNGFKPEKNKWINKVMSAIHVCMLPWLMGGAVVRLTESPFWLAVYASLDRTVWNAMITFLIFAYIHGAGGMIHRYLSWGGFQVAGRLVYPAMLVHWHLNLLPLASALQPFPLSMYQLLTNWASAIVLAMVLALPLHLLVELPFQKMLT